MFRQIATTLLAGICLIGASVASAQDTDRGRSVVRVSYIPGNFALPLLVGIEHGLFAREGLFLSAVPVTEEGAIMRSLGQGGTDFAIGSQSLLLSLAENKIEARVVALAGYGREIELIVPIWDTGTKKLADAKGKTLLLLNGVHNFDTVPELYRALALSKPPMRLSDVNIQFIDLVNLQLIMDPRFKQAYTQRKWAGLLMFREFTSAYVNDNKARVVASNEELTKLIGRRGAQPLFASKLILDKEPKTAERFIRGWARTLLHVSDPANKEAVVRVLQIYYLRQYGFLLKKELAESYFGSAKYDRVIWTDEDIAEITINARALGAGRNLLFARIKEADKRPFKTVPPVNDFIDMSFAKKAVADLEEERKKAEKKPEDAKPQAAPVTPPADSAKPTFEMPKAVPTPDKK